MTFSGARAALLALGLVWLAGCRGIGTALFITVTFPDGQAPAQLELNLYQDGALLLGPLLRPDPVSEPLTSGQTLRVLLPDALDGKSLTVWVGGRAGDGSLLSFGEALALARKGVEVDVAVQLGQGACGGGCEAGQVCVAGACICNASSCVGGCCQGVTCVERNMAACAPAGMACTACDRVRSDTCSADGVCGCGSGPACNGGQRCVAGLCACDATSCPSGCCNGNVCESRAVTSCGNSGSSCVACSTTLADNCSSDGECRCGSTPVCAAGQTCAQGVCTGGSCNASTCASGCCGSAGCATASLTSCGQGGSACVACPTGRADHCAQGSCACGDAGTCAQGQRCSGGRCVCDATSCPTGCCNNGVCTAPSTSACGTGGAACVACSVQSDSCVQGACKCGTGSACESGARCTGGMCACDAVSCPMGCCSSGRCQAGTSKQSCGTGGVMCKSCNGPLMCRNGSCS